MRHIERRFVSVALVLAGLLFCSTASAEDIVKLNKEGIEAFSDGRFADAAGKFREAFSISAEPPLKKNEALAWFKAERCTEALTAAKEYLSLNTQDELSNTEAKTIAVRCYIERAEGELAAKDHGAATVSLADARANEPNAEDAAKIDELERQVAVQRDAAMRERQIAEKEAERRAAQDSARSRNELLGYGLMGTGGAIVLGTLIYHITLATGTSSKFKDAAASGDRATYDKLGKRLETGNWLVPALYAVGIGTAGAGAYFWWSTQRETDTQAGLGTTEFGIGIAGQF